jgi:hypothetical protein
VGFFGGVMTCSVQKMSFLPSAYRPVVLLVASLLTVALSSGRVDGEELDNNNILSEDSTFDTLAAIDSSSNFVVSIQRVTVQTGRLRDTLDMILEAGNNSLAAFDFRLAVESEFVEILDVLQGEIMDSCSWEYFNARAAEPTERENYPRSVWHVVALAELIPDETRPACFGFDRPVSLVRIVVSSEHVELVPDTTAAIFFFWERCSDNSISGIRGDTLSMSDQLYDYFPVREYDTEGIFPTHLGAPNQCIDPAAKNRPIRRIDFHNGGVEFDLRLMPKALPDSANRGATDSLQ